MHQCHTLNKINIPYLVKTLNQKYPIGPVLTRFRGSGSKSRLLFAKITMAIRFQVSGVRDWGSE